MSTTIGALHLADWRRRVTGLYSGVRQMSASHPAAAHELWRSGRDELFAGHPLSPLLPDDRASFTGLPVTSYDPDWRFELEVRRAAEPVRVDVSSAADGSVSFALVGTVRLPYIGSLELWRIAAYGGGLFLSVRDGLAGAPGGTFPRGRLLLDTVNGADLGPGAADDALIIDFNFAYNPAEAYDPSWSSPLPPGNVVTADIPVGERMPR
ncbi:DUF1684 domain-containing protein [Agromyces atrinae]|uniref:DUF1684 domain-containing protein n=1 Tax=Agromyces atrinae TaxID=592376 RepID=A0A4Q2M6M1_9MICO|nr:DUF1684 domain-containing protein [Agromyces atrinae]NYD66923.1 hypothetical protein [Agromyces atrinae]RXZ87568.1 DUF1684 domain-containing protein [Agromyces atrinae]